MTERSERRIGALPAAPPAAARLDGWIAGSVGGQPGRRCAIVLPVRIRAAERRRRLGQGPGAERPVGKVSKRWELSSSGSGELSWRR